MKEYKVYAKEVNYWSSEVTAACEEDAKEKAKEGWPEEFEQGKGDVEFMTEKEMADTARDAENAALKTQAMSNSLNYADLKRKAVSARSFRISQPSRSGTSFSGGQNFSFQLPAAARQYADLGNCYLSFDIYHKTGDGIDAANCGFSKNLIRKNEKP